MRCVRTAPRAGSGWAYADSRGAIPSVATASIHVLPNGNDSLMERRVFLAILLAAVVMYGWQALFPPPEQEQAASSTPTSAPQPPASSTSPAPAAAPAPVEPTQPSPE